MKVCRVKVRVEPEESYWQGQKRRLQRTEEAFRGGKPRSILLRRDEADIPVSRPDPVASPLFDPDVTRQCWPVTVTSSVDVSFDRLEQGKVAAIFSGLSFQAITSFFAFELTGRASGEERQGPVVTDCTAAPDPASSSGSGRLGRRTW